MKIKNTIITHSTFIIIIITSNQCNNTTFSEFEGERRDILPSPHWSTTPTRAPSDLKPTMSGKSTGMKISKKYFPIRKSCNNRSYHRHRLRNDVSSNERSNVRCTNQRRWCCKRRRHPPQHTAHIRFEANERRRSNRKQDHRIYRSYIDHQRLSNGRPKRHKHSHLNNMSEPAVLSMTSSIPIEEQSHHLQPTEANEQKYRKQRKMEIKKHQNTSGVTSISMNFLSITGPNFFPTASISYNGESSVLVRPLESARSRTFKITLGQVVPHRQKPSRQGRRRQDGIKTKRLNMTTTHHPQISSSNESFALFDGVWGSKRDELNQLIVEEDFETALMEFIELAYQDKSRRKKRSTIFQDYSGDIKITPNKSSPTSTNDALNTYETREIDEIARCGFRLNYDASKLIHLNGYFKNQLLKTSILANAISSLLFNAPFQSRHKLVKDYDHLAKLLEALISDDNKMSAAALAFDPSQVDHPLSPYVVKTRKSSRKSDKLPEGGSADEFARYNVSNLSKDRYAMSGFKGYEWFWKLRTDYSYILWQHGDVCLQNASNDHLRIALTGKNESIWGPIQSDCLIRRLDKSNRVKSLGSSDMSFGSFAIWTIAYSVPIFGCGRFQSPVFLGVLKIDLDISDIEFNQCNHSKSSPVLFQLIHNCPQHTQCQHQSLRGFRRGSYRCLCGPVELADWNHASLDSTSHGDPFSSPDSIETIDSLITTNSTSNDTFILQLPISSSPPTSVSTISRACYLDGRHLERCYLDQFFNRSNSPPDTGGAKSTQNVCRECSVFIDASGCPSSYMYDHHRNQQLLDEYNYWMRGLPLGIQCFTILTGFTIAVAVARLKKNRVMLNSIWILMEFTILGAIILHFSVILAYFESTPTNCIVIIWCREIGFLLVYGSLLLKLHRTLSEFQSRKAHRVQWRDRDLVRCLLFILFILIFSLASWTAAVVDSLGVMEDLLSLVRIDPSRRMVALSFSIFSTIQGVCRLSIKDRLLEAGELLFLAYSAYMCYKIRKAPSEYYENRYITFCVLNETLVSVIYYSFRYFSNTVLHPDYMFLAFFIRCHVTASTTIILVICSKLWYSCWPPREAPTIDRTRSYSAAPSVDSRGGHQPNNPTSPSASPPVQSEPSMNNTGNWDLTEFDIANSTAEDIRYELRKLYTQLQIYKTKTMRQDNPHISKRRGGKKQTNRKFSFQTLHSKYKQQSSFSSSHAVVTTPSGSGGFSASMGGDHGENSMATVGGEAELSVRSPEDSSNSMEGVSVYMDESSYAAPEVNTGSETTKKYKTLKSILSAARNKSKRGS